MEYSLPLLYPIELTELHSIAQAPANAIRLSFQVKQLPELSDKPDKRQFEERLKAGSLWNETSYIFATEFGEPINYGTPTQLFTKIKNRLNLPEQRFHDLRHFHATQLLKAGTPLHVVAHRLGHRDPMVTATTYAHITADQAVNVSVVFAKAVE